MTAIHPIWEIDENARILRVCVWFNPIHPPNVAEIRASVVSIVGFSEDDVMKRIVMGGNFITVERSSAVVRDVPWRTSGNQKWNGARPSLMAIAAVSNKQDVGFVS